MGRDKAWHQPDLFGDGGAIVKSEPMPAEFVARIRGELLGTLALVRQAATLPWRDLTAATLAELRFNSIADWLPGDEADELRKCFGREMMRLYAAADRDAAQARDGDASGG